jgi:hypothetical protein
MSERREIIRKGHAPSVPNRRVALLTILMVSVFLASSVFAQDTITNVMSPVVSYQFYDSLEHLDTNSAIVSPVVSYQYFDWVGYSNLQSPVVSYFYPAGSGVVDVYPTLSYSPASGTLTMTARAIDPLYGNVTSGVFGWSVEWTGGATISVGVGSYNSSAGRWEASTVFGSGLAPGAYTMRYSIFSEYGGQGAGFLSFTVAVMSVVVNGTVKDAGSETSLSGAQVAIFAAGGAGGLWTLVSSQYGGVVPSLGTLLAQLTPIRPVITTSAEGAFSWADVPVGNSFVLVVAKSGYEQQYSGAFSVGAAGGSVTRDFRLSATSQTLAALAGDVDALQKVSEDVLNYNAALMASLSSAAKDDNLLGELDLLSFYSQVASYVGLLNPGGQLGGLSDAIGGVSMETAIQAILANSLLNGGKKLVQDAAKDLYQRVSNDLVNNTFPITQAGFMASEYHTYHLNLLQAAEAGFDAAASRTTPAAGFDFNKARLLTKQEAGWLGQVTQGDSIFVAHAKFTDGMGILKLETMRRQYDDVAEVEHAAGTGETVLSTVQIVGTAVTIGCVAGVISAPIGGISGTVTTAAGLSKYAVQVGRISLKRQMAFVFIDSVGTYAEDNGVAVDDFTSTTDLLVSEASSPWYLKSGNTFSAATDVNLNLLHVFGYDYMFTWGLPRLDAARANAGVTVWNTGNVASDLRVTGYGVWSPITVTGLLGLGGQTLLTSSDWASASSVPAGGAVQMQINYQGYSRNFLSQLKPHYLTMDTYSGPWKVGSTYKPFYVFGLGEVLRPMSLNAPLSLTSSDVVAPASSSTGQVRANDLKFRPKDVTRLVVDTLSAEMPVLSISVTAGTNLWALDIRLFAPAEAGLSLLVTDGKGQRLGYSSTNGLTYNELIGFVTDQGQHPISLRLLNPPAGVTYTVTVALLTPGPQPVPVSLFSEAEEVSGAIMVSTPSRVILDGDRGAVRSVDVNVVEASQQQALTNVTGTLSNLVQWGGTAVLPLLTNTTQSVPDIGAGQSGSVSWPVQISDAAQRGKYVGTVRLSSAQTAELDVRVVAVVRHATNMVSLFEGTNSVSGILQTTVTNGSGGDGETWVHVPKGYYVVHAQMGMAANSTNLLNPTIDVGADSFTEWAFSGLFDLGVVVDNLEMAFNNYLLAHPPKSNTVAVPIRLTGSTGSSMEFGGLQLYLETVPNELRAIEVLPDGKASFELLAQPGYRYIIQASTNLLSWQSLGSVLATNSVMPFTDVSAGGLSARFYRAVLE